MTRARTPARSRRRRSGLRTLLVAGAAGAIFVLGLAIGQATSGDPEPGPAVTTVRTIVPLASVRETVTVTTTVAESP